MVPYMDFIKECIYLNNGEFNWDAIGTISNIILVLSLVCVTFLYTHEVKEQTNLIKKANKRIIVLDCVENFLNPCLNEMKDYIQNINNNDFYWNQSNGKSQISHIWKITGLEYGKGFAKVDVFKKHPDLKALCSEYDELHDEIIQVYNKIKRAIETTANEECLEDFVQKFLVTGNVFEAKASTDPVKYFLETLVNYEYYRQHGEKTEIKIKFLNFDDNIIGCVKTPEYNELDEVRAEKIDQIKEKINEIIEKIEEITYSYRQEYCIS